MQKVKTLFLSLLSTLMILGPGYYDLYIRFNEADAALDQLGAEPITISYLPFISLYAFMFLVLWGVQFILLLATQGKHDKYLSLSKRVLFFAIPVVQYLIAAYGNLYKNLGYEPGEQPAWPYVATGVVVYIAVIGVYLLMTKKLASSARENTK